MRASPSRTQPDRPRAGPCPATPPPPLTGQGARGQAYGAWAVLPRGLALPWVGLAAPAALVFPVVAPRSVRRPSPLLAPGFRRPP